METEQNTKLETLITIRQYYHNVGFTNYTEAIDKLVISLLKKEYPSDFTEPL